MQELINKGINIFKKNREVISYLFFGVLTTIVSVASYTIFAKLFGMNYQVSNVLSWILAVLFAFVTNKIYVFQSKTENKKELLKEAIKFFECRILTLFIEIALMFVLVDLIKMNDVIVKLIDQFIIIVLNYVLSKVIIFKKSKEVK